MKVSDRPPNEFGGFRKVVFLYRYEIDSNKAASSLSHLNRWMVRSRAIHCPFRRAMNRTTTNRVYLSFQC